MRNAEYSRVYLLAANEDNVITEFTKLRQTSGCEYLPGIASADSTRRYIQLAKKGLQPAGVAFVDTNNNTYGLRKGSSEYDHTDVPELDNLAGQLPPNSNILFVNSVDDTITAFETDNFHNMHIIPLKVIDDPTINIPNNQDQEQTVPALAQVS